MRQLTDALLQRDPSQRLDVASAMRRLLLPAALGDSIIDADGKSLRVSTGGATGKGCSAAQHNHERCATELGRSKMKANSTGGSSSRCSADQQEEATAAQVHVFRERLAAAYGDLFRYMELSVTAEDEVQQLEFQDVFVLLHVEENIGGATRREIRPSQVPSIADDQNRRVVLIEAEAGWGKSTLLRDLARTQDDSTSGFVSVHADLRALLDTPTTTVPSHHSQLYSKAAAAAANLVSDYFDFCEDSTALLEHLTSSQRASPVVWLFDALDEVSANRKWDRAVQTILTHKVMPRDIVVFTARPSRSQNVRSSHWDAMRLAVRRWTPADVDVYVRKYAAQMAPDDKQRRQCVSQCQMGLALLAGTEFEAVPLFCELVCYTPRFRARCR